MPPRALLKARSNDRLEDAFYMPSGSFLASFDYWPEKVQTDDMPLYGMEWRIFSREEIDSLIAEARRHGFEVVGDIDYGETWRPAIHNAGRRYTFAWIALRKEA